RAAPSSGSRRGRAAWHRRSDGWRARASMGRRVARPARGSIPARRPGFREAQLGRAAEDGLGFLLSAAFTQERTPLLGGLRRFVAAAVNDEQIDRAGVGVLRARLVALESQPPCESPHGRALLARAERAERVECLACPLHRGVSVPLTGCDARLGDAQRDDVSRLGAWAQQRLAEL